MGEGDSFWASCFRELRRFIQNHIQERLAALASLDESARRLVDEEMRVLRGLRDDTQSRVDYVVGRDYRRETAALVTVWLETVDTLGEEVDVFDRCLRGVKTTSASARKEADTLQHGHRGGCCRGLCTQIDKCCCGVCSWLELSGGHLCGRIKVSGQVAGLIGRARHLNDDGQRIKEQPDEQLYVMSDGGIRTAEIHLVGASAADALRRTREFLWDANEGGVIGICGMGGVGKTALLEQIRHEYNQTRPSSEQPAAIWAEVTPEQLLEQPSRTNMVNIQSLRDSIGGQLQPAPPSAAGWTAESLRAVLSRKRCLLLLENVWEALDLDMIGIPRNKCKIVVTTRSDTVVTGMYAERVKLDRLREDEDLSLFQRHLNNDKLLDANEHHAKLIVKECHGLPLALKVMAAVLRNKTGKRDWIDTIEGLRDPRRRFHNMGGEGDRSVFRVLSYSYNQLKAEWQPCLLYCSLFGNNMDISREALVDYWIGEGFLDGDVAGSDDTETARQNGRRVVNELVSTYLLECSSGNEEDKVKMHSLIRDMAIKIAGEKFLVYPISTTRREQEDEYWGRAERISMMGSNASKLPKRNCPNLATLLLNNCWLLTTIPPEFFQQAPLLRLLDLSDSGILVIPREITNLKQLWHLNLSHTKIVHLPVEVGELEKLRHLDLSSTLKLETVPYKAISGLSKLRRLNMFKSKYQRWVWDARDERRGLSLSDLERLSEDSELEELALNINDPDSFDYLIGAEDSKLAQSTVCLYLEGFRGLIFDTPFHHLTSLRELYLTNILDLEQLIVERRWFLNLEVLQLSSLSVAAIVLVQEEPAGYDICRLSRVEVSDCRNLQDLSWVKHLVRLETISVRDCNNLRVVIAADDGRGGGPCCFECLRVITLSGLPNLESFCRSKMRMKVDPTLSINNCPKLTGELLYDDAGRQERRIRYQDCQRQIA